MGDGNALGIFAKAFLVKPPKILGIQLRPFSAYHALVLQMLESPFLAGERPVTIEDLLTGILVCSEGYKANLRAYLRFQNSRLSKTIWALRLLFRNTDQARLDFAEYVRTYLVAPSYWMKDDQRMSKVPYPFRISVTILENIGSMRPEEVWDMGLTLVACYKACIDETHGADLADKEIAEMEQKLGLQLDRIEASMNKIAPEETADNTEERG